jgi:hypothetical protein
MTADNASSQWNIDTTTFKERPNDVIGNKKPFNRTYEQ